jgi:hypothetical protein
LFGAALDERFFVFKAAFDGQGVEAGGGGESLHPRLKMAKLVAEGISEEYDEELVIVERAHGNDAAMEFFNFRNGLTNRSGVIESDFEGLFHEKTLRIRAEIFVSLSEGIEHVETGGEFFYEGVISGRDVFEKESLERAVVLGPNPVPIGVFLFFWALE